VKNPPVLAADLFRPAYVPLAPPGIGDAAGNVDHPLIFSSGMSRRGDYLPALAANHSIGIDIGEMSANAIAELAGALAAAPGAHLFVDSGAFSLFRAGLRGKPGKLDFDRVFEKYEALALAVSRADDSGCASCRVHYVLPDVVGDPEASLAALERFAEAAADMIGFNGILPVHHSAAISPLEFYDRAAAILGRDDLVIGVPSAEAAMPNKALLELLAARPAIYGVHVLGAASEKKAGPRLAVLRDAGFDGGVSLDANRLRGYWNAYSSRKEALARLLAGLPPKRRADLVAA
jgi:hypothetical protein